MTQQSEIADSQGILVALEEFAETSTWSAARDLLQHHPELLTDRANMVIEQQIAAAREKNDMDTVHRLEGHRDLLKSCRMNGIKQAFNEHAVIQKRIANQIFPLIDQIVRANTWHETQHLVERYPELAEPFSLAVLSEMQRAYEQIGSTTGAYLVAELLPVLQRCEEVGVAEAFAQHTGSRRNVSSELEAVLFQFVDEDNWSEKQRILEQHPELLDDRLIALLEDGKRVGEAIHHEEDAHAFAEHITLLHRCREVGVKQAFAEALAKNTILGRDVPHELAVLLVQLLNVPNWREKQRIVEQHSELLDQQVINLLENGHRIHESKGESQRAKALAEHVAVLRRCREVGIEQAFADKITDDLPEEMRAFFRALEEFPLEQREALEREFVEIITRSHTVDEMLASLSKHAELRHVLERISENIIPPPIIQAFDEFVRAKTWEDSRHVLNQHPELLGDDAENMLERLIQGTKALRGENAAHSYIEYRNLLYRCREVGVEQAFAEKLRAHAARFAFAAELQSYMDLAQEAEARYQETNDAHTLEEALSYLERILQHSDLGRADVGFRRVAYTMAGGLYSNRFQIAGNPEDLTHSVECFQEAIRQSPPDLADLPMLNNHLGVALIARYTQTHNLLDLEDGIHACEQALAQTPNNSPDLPQFLNGLAIALMSRYDRAHNRIDLDRAVELYDNAVNKMPHNSRAFAGLLNNLAESLIHRYNDGPTSNDLDHAVVIAQQAVDYTQAGSRDFPLHLSTLGVTLRLRYEREGDEPDLDHAIETFQMAVDKIMPGSPYLPSSFNNLGSALMFRYERKGQRTDLQKSIQYLERSVQMTPPGSTALAIRLNNLGNGLLHIYDWSRDRADLERAIHAYEMAKDLALDGSLERTRALHNLGTALLRGNEHTHSPTDLARVVELFRQAVEQTPTSSPDFPRNVSSLGQALVERAEATHDLGDLEEGIRLILQSIQLTSSGTPELPIRLSHLSRGLTLRYQRTHALDDLEQAIQSLNQAVKLSPPGSLNVANYLTHLAEALVKRHENTKAFLDLEDAIQALDQAVAQTAADSRDLPVRLDLLGARLLSHYQLTGNLTSLERAIEQDEQAVHLTPSSSPDLPRRINNLGHSLRTRYNRTRVIDDLQRAIKILMRAHELAEPNSPERGSISNNLGAALINHYEIKGEATDLNQAISILEQSVRLGSNDPLHLSARLSNLANGLRLRYEHALNLADLQRAVEVLQQAVENTSSELLALTDSFTNLGNALNMLYAQTKELIHLDGAIRAYEHAVEQTPADSPSLSGYLINLGVGLILRYIVTETKADLDRAIANWEQAWSLSQTTFAVSPIDYKLGQQQASVGLSKSLVEAYLRRSIADPSQAALSRRSALVIAEGSKSRVLTELVGRGDLPAPPAISAVQTARERELLTALSALDTVDLAVHGSQVAPEEVALRVDRHFRRERYRKELEDLWKVMAQSGSDALEYVTLRRGVPLTWDDLDRLATELGSETALLSLFCGDDQILLFTLLKDGGEPVVVQTKLEASAQYSLWQRFFREVHCYDGTGRRGETWQRPLVQLMEQVAPHLDRSARLVFVPHSLGHLIPWSVPALQAGWCATEGVPLPVVTLPAMGLLAPLRRRPHAPDNGALVVGNPLGDLPYAEEEALLVAEMLGTVPLIGSHATKEAVLKKLATCSVVHFATHAHFDPHSPLDSGIVLADSILTAREVMSSRLLADILVLSACETGMAGVLGGDELIGLSQSFLQAGARSLIVSLWRVNDPATAFLMAEFYTVWRTGADKPEALSRAMVKTKNQPQWSHSYFWAPFVFIGDWT